MRKNFGPKTMCYPMPVFIIGTYNADGAPNAKLQPISYDSMNHDYLVLGEKVGNAFHDGLTLK